MLCWLVFTGESKIKCGVCLLVKQIKYIEDQTNVIHAADDIPIPMHQPFILAEACMISRISVEVTSGTGKFITTIRPFVPKARKPIIPISLTTGGKKFIISIIPAIPDPIVLKTIFKAF